VSSGENACHIALGGAIENWTVFITQDIYRSYLLLPAYRSQSSGRQAERAGQC